MESPASRPMLRLLGSLPQPAIAGRDSSGSSPLWQRRGLRLRVQSSMDACGEPERRAQEAERANRRLAEDFSIVGRVGQGTTSSVQHAIRQSDGRHVALKTMRAEDPEMIAFARQEFETLRKIEHPNIVGAVDFIEAPGRATVVLDFFDGRDLQETVSSMPDRRLPEEVAMPLIAQLVDAVMHLHASRIVHRDIKPQNVLVSRDLKQLKLVDFNVARNLQGGPALTPTGTRLYTAPEVVLGESPSELSDIWSVGLCAYLLLSGSLPQGRDRCG